MNTFRYTLLFLLLTVFSFQIVQAQITTEPSFPTADRPVTITFDATDTGLEGYSGSVYAHTGLIVTEQDQNSGDWEYVIGDWGDNNVQPELDMIGQDLWELHIDDMYAFYDAPETEDIYQIALVFRSSDQGMQTADLFVDVYSEIVVVRFDQPTLPQFGPAILGENELLQVEVSANSLEYEITSVELFVNDDVVAVSDSAFLAYDIEIDASGRSQIRAVAEDTQGNTAESSFQTMVNPAVTEAPVPDGLELGINYHNQDDRATFVLWAPEKEFVYLIGDFNDWEPETDYFMARETVRSDSVLYWITVDGLEPGVEYGFQYLIDGDIRMGDPFSHKVLSPWNDQYISGSVYPNLKEYPHGKTNHMVSVMQTGQEPYDWQAVNYQRPDQAELIIYELVIRDFLEDGTYSTLADTLDYLKRLGVNAIELMPVSNFDGNDSWGYNPNFHLALDKAYGPADEFRRLVDEAHKRDMAVILDVVYNHATGQSPLIRLYSESGETNPLIGPGHAFNVFNHLNHDHPFIKYWMDRANRYWMEEYNVDGYRFDLTKGFATNVQDGGLLQGPNPERIVNLKRMADELWSYDPETYIILEHFADNAEEKELAEYRLEEGMPGMMLWGNHNYNYSEASMGWHGGSQSNFSGVYHENRGWDVPNLIGYMESHDEQWLMFKNLNYGNSVGGYDITELETALDRQKLVGAFFLTIPGPKMIWQFGELGYGGGPNECLKPGDDTDGECRPDDPGRTARKPVRWDYYDDPNRNALYQTWQWLLKLRHEHPVFHDTATDVAMHGMNTATKTITLQHETKHASITGNFGVNERDVFPRFTHEGTWYDYFSGDEIEVSSDMVGDSYSMSLPPGVFRIFTSEPVETPPAGLTPTSAAIDQDPSDLPERFTLDQNYPNPFNPATNIAFELPEAVQVKLHVYNIIGQRVSTLVNEFREAGSYTVVFDASQLGSGTYLIKMDAGGHRFTRKMMLIK